jgi:hypothetical protein
MESGVQFYYIVELKFCGVDGYGEKRSCETLVLVDL